MEGYEMGDMEYKDEGYQEVTGSTGLRSTRKDALIIGRGGIVPGNDGVGSTRQNSFSLAQLARLVRAAALTGCKAIGRTTQLKPEAFDAP
ncbi:ABC multidrug transporter [Aspergillus luchuensis]|uniref:ABC multidrug transporter n=1 Tax=Aspergillus kawachii TaxID=1069201 RepID=A0A146FCK6_ASPKA|nr:ABC multidrug transporter [Aspergillus luchuensis]